MWSEPRPSAEQVEAVVERLFADETERRRGRLRLYAMRKFSALGTNAIARRYGRTPAAVPVAVKEVERRAGRSRPLAERLGELCRGLEIVND